MKTLEIKGYQVLLDDDVWEWASKRSWFVNKANLSRSGKVYFIGSFEGRKRVKRQLHRLIMGVGKGDLAIDHISGDTLDNQRSNLRVCTTSENSRNAKRRRDNSSGYKGVNFHKFSGHWRATIQVDKKQIHLGLFNSAEEAYKAYCEASKKYHGEFGRTN